VTVELYLLWVDVDPEASESFNLSCPEVYSTTELREARKAEVEALVPSIQFYERDVELDAKDDEHTEFLATFED
jgi:hypothetical protein